MYGVQKIKVLKPNHQRKLSLNLETPEIKLIKDMHVNKHPSLDLSKIVL